jgi:pilus assembly protein Flp/PilA
MKLNLFALSSTIHRLVSRQDGQDLIEYALVVALIALGATAGMGSVATDINTAFTNIGTSLTTAI